MARRHIFKAGLAAAALLLPAAIAAAEPYTIFIYEPQSEIDLRTDQTEAGADYWAAWAAYGQSLAEAGAARGGAPLIPAPSVRADGMIMGGYFIVEAESAEAAQALAAAAPSVSRGGDAIAIAHLPTPPMMDNQ